MSASRLYRRRSLPLSKCCASADSMVGSRPPKNRAFYEVSRGRLFMSPEIEYRIGESWEAGAAPDIVDDTNPSDVRDVLACYRLAAPEQVRRAMNAAEKGAVLWRGTSALARAAVLSKAAQILRGDRDDVARGISLENGKTLAEANIEVEKSADFLDFYAATARMPQGGIIADGRPGT